MARDNNLHSRRKTKIVQYYARLDATTEHGVKKHTTAWCIRQTAEFFDLKPKTVEAYIYN